MSSDRSRSLAALATALLLTGCAGAPDGAKEDSAPPSPTVAASSPAPPPATAPPVPNPLAGSFTELANTISATIGVAFAPVGTSDVTSLGEWTTGVAWSTSKVPLAIAALRADHAAAQSPAARAITQSDNAAAEELWSQLGAPEQAAQKVQDVLREAGDQTTEVQSHRVRAGFTAFGQTKWTLQLQAQFAAHLPCLSGSALVLDWMANLSAGNWGLANNNAPSKGGWGPGESGGYLVRQFGIMHTDTGDVGVALAADASSFDAGVAALNQIASWLKTHTAELPTGHCPN